MNTTTTANVHDDTTIAHVILGISASSAFASLRLGGDTEPGAISLLFDDPDDLGRLGAECLAAENALRAAQSIAGAA